MEGSKNYCNPGVYYLAYVIITTVNTILCLSTCCYCCIVLL